MKFEKYKVTTPYPLKNDYTTIFFYSEGKLRFIEEPDDEIRKVGDHNYLANNCTKEISVDTEKYKQKLKEYYEEEPKKLCQFWKDLFEELGIPENHPKSEKFREIAWSYGHSGGLQEVYAYATELSELIDK
jgi:hypothetical protein